MGQTSKPDRFETVLERGRRTLGDARDRYDALEGTGIVPDRLVETIGELERELDDLDQTLEVTDADVELAEDTVERIALLARVLAALRERQRTVVEAEVRRLGHHVSAVAELVRDRGLEDEIVGSPGVNELTREHSMLDRLVENERYGRVETSDRISLEGLEAKVREVATELAEVAPDGPRARATLDACHRLLEDVHEALGALGDRNDDRTDYADQLRTVKERIETAETALDDGDAGSAAADAEDALEDCLTLHLETARARARQRVTDDLAAAVEEFDVSVDCDVEACVARGDTAELLEAITAVIVAEIDDSADDRVRQLLVEHDGSVVRTAAATDYEVSTLLEHVDRLHGDGAVTDVVVDF